MAELWHTEGYALLARAMLHLAKQVKEDTLSRSEFKLALVVLVECGSMIRLEHQP